jgi:hypothetical protein
MFRILYLVVLVAGILWIVQANQAWLDPVHMAEMPASARDDGSVAAENAQMNELARRIKLVAVAVVAVIVASEVWHLVWRHLPRRI